MKKLTLWWGAGAGLEQRTLTGSTWLAPGPAGRFGPTDVPSADCVEVFPLDGPHPAVALAMVPVRAGSVARNGVPVGEGAHVLHHADRLDVNAEPFWISLESRPVDTVYDPGTHPADAYCFLTRVRLTPGEPIVICPGRPDAACSMIYRKAAWVASTASSARFSCPNCGYVPGEGEWHPPLPRSTRSLHYLFHLVAKESRHRDAQRQTSP